MTGVACAIVGAGGVVPAAGSVNFTVTAANAGSGITGYRQGVGGTCSNTATPWGTIITIGTNPVADRFVVEFSTPGLPANTLTELRFLGDDVSFTELLGPAVEVSGGSTTTLEYELLANFWQIGTVYTVGLENSP